MAETPSTSDSFICLDTPDAQPFTNTGRVTRSCTLPSPRPSLDALDATDTSKAQVPARHIHLFFSMPLDAPAFPKPLRPSRRRRRCLDPGLLLTLLSPGLHHRAPRMQYKKTHWLPYLQPGL